LVGGSRTRALFRLFAWPKDAQPSRSQKRTWAEKITDDKNQWLEARRLELEGDLRGASDAYARDKQLELDQGHDARAALSAASEARCLEELGLDGSHAYVSAARLYVSAASIEVRTNPRAAMQLFERARECFDLSHTIDASLAVTAQAEAIRVALDISDGYKHPSGAAAPSLAPHV